MRLLLSKNRAKQGNHYGVRMVVLQTDNLDLYEAFFRCDASGELKDATVIVIHPHSGECSYNLFGSGFAELVSSVVTIQ